MYRGQHRFPFISRFWDSAWSCGCQFPHFYEENKLSAWNTSLNAFIPFVFNSARNSLHLILYISVSSSSGSDISCCSSTAACVAAMLEMQAGGAEEQCGSVKRGEGGGVGVEFMPQLEAQKMTLV